MKRKKDQLSFEKVGGWGGKRRGSGRPNLSNTVNHMKRPVVDLKKPLHITMRLKEKFPSIRNKRLLKEFKKSTKGAKRHGLYVIHFSLQRNHIHMILEAKNNKSLGAGMRSLGGRFAKCIRAYVFSGKGGDERGSVFSGRYHLHALETPREMKNALEYVLLNNAKHMDLIEHLDPFSSGAVFSRWAKLLGRRFSHVIKAEVKILAGQTDHTEMETALSPPQSWLCQQGWIRACA